MTVLDQSHFKGEYHPPGRTYRRRPRFLIKKTPEGLVWWSRKKKKALTKPAPTRPEAKRMAKLKLAEIKACNKNARRAK
jgi:hypothetical protein